MSIPVLLLFIDDHSEHLSHGIVLTRGAAVAVRLIGSCRCFPHALELGDSVRQLGAELEAVVGVETNGTSPKRDTLVHQDVSSAVRSDLGRGNGIHIRVPAETVGEKEDLGVSFWRNREGAGIIVP